MSEATRQNLLDKLRAARLYVITPDREPDRVMDLAAAVLRGGADILQLRHKHLARGALLELAHRLRDVTSESGALFIVNDHLDLALLSRADGVHLGPADLTVASARRVGGEGLLIGASASTPSSAQAAVEAGADYIGSGPAFATSVKPEKAVIGPQGVADVAGAVGSVVPVFAIGGIEEANLRELTALGVHRVCVIRALGEASNPESAARRLRAMLES